MRYQRDVSANKRMSDAFINLSQNLNREIILMDNISQIKEAFLSNFYFQ